MHAAAPLNRIVAFGGQKGQNFPDHALSSVSSVSTAGDMEWQDEPFELPHPCYRGVSVVLSNRRRVLLIGGLKGTGLSTLADVLQWDPHSPTSPPTFTTINNALRQSRGYCDAVPIDSNTKIVIAGGYNGKKSLKSAELFVESLNRCVHLPDMNEARQLFGMAPDTTRQPNQVVVTGGWDAKRTVESFDLAEMRWLVGVAMNKRRHWHAAASLGSRVYVVGGWHMRSAECLDSRESRWQLTAGMINQRYAHRLLAADEHRLFALGNWHSPQNAVEILDERNQQWREARPMTTGRFWFQAAVL